MGKIVRFLNVDYSNVTSEEEFEETLDKYVKHFFTINNLDVWKEFAEENPGFRHNIPNLNDGNLVCQGEACPYATKCPILIALRNKKDFKSAEKMLGTECRVDRLDALKLFLAFLQDLKVEPLQQTDIISISSLVRLNMTKRQIDWRIALEGLTIKEEIGATNRSEKVLFKEVAHPLFKVAERVDKQISTLLQQLLATRKERSAANSELNKAARMLELLMAGQFEELRSSTSSGIVNL